MGVREHLRDPVGIGVACLSGGLAGAVAAAKAPSPWWAAPVALVTTLVVLAVHVVTGIVMDRRGRDESRIPRQPMPPTPIPPQATELPGEAASTEPVSVINKSVAVVFIHGLLSSAKVWSAFQNLISADPDLAALELCYFEYSSPFVKISPSRRIPDFDVIAAKLKTYLEDDLGEYPALVLVTHSQGGLVAQRFLAQMLNNGRGQDLARVKRVIMFACPNSGSELALTLRRLLWFWRHPQERELRPLNAAITAAHRVVINQVIHARRVTPQRCPISLSVYAGEEDNVVTSTAAFSVLPEDQTGVLPGDHFSIVRPTSPSHSAYLTLRKKLLAVLTEHTMAG